MKKFILFTLYLIPVLLLIGFVANFSVNVPVDDEWRLASLFEKIAQGNVTFNDFWALHSNHRILFPKIIIAVLAFASRWNINYQLCLSIGLAAITFLAMYKLSSMQVKNVGDDLWHLANILTCILVFSLVQHENWLWGFQLAWFIVNLCFVAAVYALVSNHKLLPNIAVFNRMKQRCCTNIDKLFRNGQDARSTKIQCSCGTGILPVLENDATPQIEQSRDTALSCPYYIQISIAALFCFIASFSLAQGLLSWLAAIPAVAALEGNAVEKRKRLILWILLFAATCAVYSIDYHPSRKTSIISLLNKPLVVIDYFLSLLGSPIVRSSGISALVGLLIFAIFLFLGFHFGRKITEHHEALPWLSIGLFSVLSALFITAGRAEFGAIQALESSRYTTNSILLLIAVVQLGQLFVRGNDRETKATLNHKYIFFYRMLAGLLIATIIVNSQQAIAQTRSALLYKQGAQDCLQLINYLQPSDFFDNSPESCLRVLSKKTWLVREGAAIIDKIGWKKFAKNVEFISNTEKVYGYLDQPQTSDKSVTVKKNSAVKASGWAVLPGNLKQPNIVLLSVGDKQSFFANAYVNLNSPDIAKSLKSELYNNARWAVDLSDNNLPIAQTEIKAWVYNPVDNQFVQLRGG
ncbi:hypothetical protein Osc7112_0101 [Oscillatoria nigro-viridis PCC 7112]|uniref:Uncharacterized protein n=1 Tax=Phormidium nigroviride PCC 7112 TaxID=179408 RepID=K9V9I7_9CYAN|nr:hypothetical protein [Oscillatoria nigro-viridis]AFZ04743.1 hypothetical protein Osc7112_0101 [Oscillatoria nigro-viridis PCC 7112]